MIINGREIRFKRTVLANCELLDALGGDWDKAEQIFSSGYVASQRFAARMMAILSNGAEQAAHFADPVHDPHPLSEVEALSLEEETFSALFSEAMEAFRGDGKTTVQGETPKGKKTVKAAGK